MMLEDLIADGAMFQLPMKMDMRVPDVLMLEMIHGTVEINMIPPPAPQDGHVMLNQENVLWPTQVMDLDQSPLVKTTANHIQDHQAQEMINTDAILPTILVINVRMVILDVTQIDQLHVAIARTQIQLNSSNVTEPTQTTQNVNPALKMILKVACHKVKPVTVAHQSHNFSSVIQRLLLVSKLRMPVTSSKLVLPHADTSPLKSSSEPGEVLWPRRANQKTLIWEKLI
jgi:hypothetical protein